MAEPVKETPHAGKLSPAALQKWLSHKFGADLPDRPTINRAQEGILNEMNKPDRPVDTMGGAQG